jgi:hypothetical protein
MRLLPTLVGLSFLASATLAEAAKLDTTPDTLIARANRLRDAKELSWNPDAGYLGNLRHVQIVAPDCLVRVISGPENRLISGRAAVGVNAQAIPRACASRCRSRRRTISCSAETG